MVDGLLFRFGFYGFGFMTWVLLVLRVYDWGFKV